MKKIFLILVSCFLILGSVNAQTVTGIDLPALKTTFNSMQGYTRVVFLGDPTCPGCIASAGDLRNSLFSQCSNPDLRGLIVWIHVNGYPSTLTDAVTQSTSWSDPRVTCFWDSLWDISYAFGYQGGWAGCNWAWDIAMIYSDTATWPGSYPLAPFYCMSKTGCCNGWNIITLRNQLNALGECATVSVDEYAASNFTSTIFPNPFTTTATISFGKEIHNATFTLWNLLGEKVAETSGINAESFRLSRGTFPSGVYVYEVTEKEKRIARGKAVVY